MSTDIGTQRTDGDTRPTTQDDGAARAVIPEQRRPEPPSPRVPTRALGSLSHGGSVIGDEAFAQIPDAAGRADLTAESQAIGVAPTEPPGTPFGYLFPDLAYRWPDDHLPTRDPGEVVAHLEALGSAMIEGDLRQATDPRPDAEDVGQNSTIPPIYTYWGQFIDHDLTANTDRDDVLSITERPLRPESPTFVAKHLRNLRQPALNLDSVYGDGPESTKDGHVEYDGKKLRIGTIARFNPALSIPPVAGGPDDHRDLFRNARKAVIGDGRNDENLVVAQLHLAFLHAHNNIIDLLAAKGHVPTADETFALAQRLLRWTYQWLVRNDFLVRLVPQDVIAAAEASTRFVPSTRGVYMPLEFSVAAYRFGHSMVRARYDWNRNFGRAADGSDPADNRASFEQLFQFTGNGGFIGGFQTLPENWPVEWDRFVTTDPQFPDRATRKIDTHLAFPLDEMRNEGTDPNTAHQVRAILKRLAVRNLLRGYKLAIPTGQAVAGAYGVPPLTAEELATGTSRIVRHALEDGGFLEATPLWFYVLKEAELGGGNQLGPVGGRIVAETIIGQLKHDKESYLAVKSDWTPAQTGNPDGQQTLRDFDGPDITGIADLLRFAKVL